MTTASIPTHRDGFLVGLVARLIVVAIHALCGVFSWVFAIALGGAAALMGAGGWLIAAGAMGGLGIGMWFERRFC